MTRQVAPSYILPLQSLFARSMHAYMDVKEYAQAEEVSAGFGVDLVLASDLSRGIGVSEMVEY